MAKIKEPKKSNFTLKKFKLKDNRVIADYNYLHDEQNNEIREYNGVKIPLLAHPDLISLYNQLREYVLREFYIEPNSENLTLVDVTGVQILDRKVLISSNFNTLHGEIVNLNTSKINLDESESGFEAEIDVIIDAIIDEVFQYLFKGKYSNPTLFGDDKEEVKGGLNGQVLKAV